MNILRSNDVKRINKIVIRKALLELRSATRKELMEATGISSSSIGSLIMEMVRDHDILEESIDSSSGGRCPMRYVLNYKQYQVMCILVDREYANVYVMDSLYQKVSHKRIPMKNQEVLMIRIKEIIAEYAIKFINVSTPGIINDDVVLLDSEEGMWEMDFFRRLKADTQLPMHLDNDVKCMVQGYYADKNLVDQNISYLYLSNEGGLGCASMAEGVIIRGSDHLAGEIGLLEYGGSSMNNLLREHPQDEATIQILSRLISVLVCCVNPSLIVLSGVKRCYEEALKREVQRVVSDRFSINFVFNENNEYHILKCLWATAMDELMHDLEENF